MLAAEAEIGAFYINCWEAIPACHTLEFLGHPQPPTPITTNNTTALGIVNNNVMKKLKAMDLKYHWLWDRISQKQFRHYWAPGSKNKCDYVTKHHTPIHREAMRSTFLTSIATLQALVTGSQISFLQQGCARHIHRGNIKVPTVSILCYTYLQGAWQTDGQRHNTTQSPCFTEM